MLNWLLANVQPLHNALKGQGVIRFGTNRYGKMEGKRGISYTVT